MAATPTTAIVDKAKMFKAASIHTTSTTTIVTSGPISNLSCETSASRASSLPLLFRMYLVKCQKQRCFHRHSKSTAFASQHIIDGLVLRVS